MFDPALVRPILKELDELARPHLKGREAEALANLTAVDGSVFAALPRMTWALWQDASPRGVKLHLQFSAAKRLPLDAVITPAACSEPAALAAMLEPGRLYVNDRGYASFELMRLVVVRIVDRTGKTTELRLVTDRFDLAADPVAIADRYRWTIELFFRWLKCVLGARHLLSHKEYGVALPMYAALIVSLLIAIRTGSKPTKRTFETIQFYLLGWVSDEEFDAHLASLKKIWPARNHPGCAHPGRSRLRTRRLGRFPHRPLHSSTPLHRLR